MAIWSKDKKGRADEDPIERAPKAVVEAQDDIRRDAIPADEQSIEDILNEESMTNTLPNPPKVPGWHFFWASTTNDRTPVQFFYRLGYTPVKREELPSMQHLKPTSAEFSGFISCNEMILLKTTEENYQRYMKVVHHDKPNQEAQRLVYNVKTMQQELGEDRDGKPLAQEVGGGFKEIEEDARRVLRKPFE